MEINKINSMEISHLVYSNRSNVCIKKEKRKKSMNVIAFTTLLERWVFQQVPCTPSSPQAFET